MTMTHPGLPLSWALGVFISMLVLALWSMTVPPPGSHQQHSWPLPGLASLSRWLTATTWPLRLLKLLIVALFLLVIIAGLQGSPIPERNIATVLTWNWWWAGLVFSVFLLGSAWCAVCPWDTLANWLVRLRLPGRQLTAHSLALKVPKALRNLWPALWLFVGLTWLELGVGITASPYATALLALTMVVLTTASLAVFERKAFCRYFCPVGRTIGFYAQLAPIELRPVDTDICARCTTLECYHGTEKVDPCPTHLVMGKLIENTYCVSCGNCTQSCPHQNIAWRPRPLSREALQTARPHWDEAWFMLCLLGLTGFHGVTMLPQWTGWISGLGQQLQDSGQLLLSFSLAMLLATALPILIYALCIGWLRALAKPSRQQPQHMGFKPLFSGCAFVALPLAFAYHLAHNLNHLVRESGASPELLSNPLGLGALPLSMEEIHLRHMNMWISPDWLSALQAGLLLLGFWIALQVIRHRGHRLLGLQRLQLFPLLLFVCATTAYHLWLLMQPMTMRM